MSIYQGPNKVLIPMTHGFGPTRPPFAYICFRKLCDDFHCILISQTNPSDIVDNIKAVPYLF